MGIRYMENKTPGISGKKCRGFCVDGKKETGKQPPIKKFIILMSLCDLVTEDDMKKDYNN